MEIDIVAVHRQNRTVLGDDGEIYPITDFMNAAGDLTDDPNEAVVAIVELGPKHWASVELDYFEPVKVN